MLSTFSGLPRTAWILFAGTVVNRLGYVVTPFLVFYLGSRGIPTKQAPYILGALGAGNLIGPMVGGLLADRVGRRPTMLTGLIGTALAQGLLFAAPNVVTLACAAALLSGAGYGVVFRDPLMRALLPLFGIALAIYSLTEVCLPLAIRDDGLPTTTLGLMATLNAVLVVVLQPVATNALARFRQIPVYVFASVLTAAGIALTGMAHDAWSYGGTVALWSIGEAMIGGIPGAIIAGLAPEDARGRYQGAFQWTWGIARFAALGVGTAVYADVGPAAVWWSSAVAGVGAALGVGALTSMIVRRTAPPVATPEPATAAH